MITEITSAPLRKTKPSPTSGPQGGQPQRILVSQGLVRPGLLQGQHWAWLPWQFQKPSERLPYVRSHADPRLSNRIER